ncbi:hypothetical protein BT96DRAFT_970411 [Gymnopus androsaceus JB14]|uniref:Fucose-specific lectin n=1 Tax=Gymnopus androsaceus JB14 TaxID=1447944 RepID=A0A6A4IK96_9AGAR|nr:hypothetical protein BT96DRAFT_970411 [Gymnopus androsaceus JB14]
MLFISKALLMLPLFLSLTLAAPSDIPTTRSANTVIPITGTNMGAVSLSDGNTRVYYQDATNGTIIQLVISNDFEIVPADEVRQNSPIAVSLLSNAAGFEQYIWEAEVTGGFQGGPTCTDCVTNKGFVGAAGSQMLYALATSGTSPPVIRYGFVLDSGDSNTISEAINTGSGWTVATLT